MKKTATRLVCAFIFVPLLHAASHAESLMSTFVSGSGKDSNPCTATSPCQSFHAASKRTPPGGVIFVLDSADYGGLTIDKSLSITSQGAVGGMLVVRRAAITIKAGPNDVINLRGLEIDGGHSGSVGIQFKSGGSLNVQKTTIRDFTNAGISFTPDGASTLFLSDTVVTGNRTNGILISAAGLAAVRGVLHRITASRNGVGIFTNGASASILIADTLAGNNTYGVGATSAAVMIGNSILTNNTVGIAADQLATVRIGNSTVTANVTGWKAINGGSVQSYGNNNASGNELDGAPSSTMALQ
jgi:hypothetical protein